jgi:hypothetical protein
MTRVTQVQVMKELQAEQRLSTRVQDPRSNDQHTRAQVQVTRALSLQREIGSWSCTYFNGGPPRFSTLRFKFCRGLIPPDS